jgi:hypothetical protein
MIGSVEAMQTLHRVTCDNLKYIFNSKIIFNTLKIHIKFISFFKLFHQCMACLLKTDLF